MGCATGMVKYLVFLANLIFVLAGLALVAIGAIYRFQYLKNVSVGDLGSTFAIVSMLFIIVGAVVFIIAFFGCCGAIRESTCMLTTYAVILLSIFLIQVAIGVFVFLQIKDTPDIRREISSDLKHTFDQYERNRAAKDSVDVTQTLLECCGVNGPDYWTSHFNNGSVPLSCCSGNHQSCSKASQYLHNQGCDTALYNFLSKSSKILGYVLLGIAAFEVLGAFFGLCLSSSIRNHYRRNIYA